MMPMMSEVTDGFALTDLLTSKKSGYRSDHQDGTTRFLEHTSGMENFQLHRNKISIQKKMT